MIDAKQNRLNYGEILKPPQHYELNHAVGTTYSLDLEAIMLIPVALFFFEDMDMNPHEIREDMLEALTQVPDKISLFCQRGKIKVPQEYNNLMAYWEKSIIQIQMDEYNQSFHPKVWIIRYTHLDKTELAQYKVIVTSRNLTFSRDWDLAITTEGKVNSQNNNQNKSLIDFLKYLNKKKQKAIPQVFFEELPHVKFNLPDGFNDLQFHPINISNSYQNPIYKDVDTRLVMSPFLDEKTLKTLKNKSKKIFLFSSREELSSISKEVLNKINFKYMFSPFIEDAENLENLSETDVEPMSQNLHAKFFIHRTGSDIYWYIGSANATQPANNRNIEFLVKIKTNAYKFDPNRIKEQLISKDKNNIQLFENFTGEYSETKQLLINQEQDIRKAIHAISGAKIKGELYKNKKNNYNLIIKTPIITLPDEIEVRFKPLPETSLNTIAIDLSKENKIEKFKEYAETDLSPFLLFEIWVKQEVKRRFVINMEIKLDNNNRQNKIFTSIINNKNKFFRYLSFLLSEELPILDNGSLDKQNQLINSSQEQNKALSYLGTPVFEKFLLASSRQPKKMKKVNDLINRLFQESKITEQEIVPENFIKLWKQFNSYLSKHGY